MAAQQAPPSLGFSRQEHWSGLPFPSPMDESESEVAQLCPTLSDPMDCSPPGYSIHGIFQATVLEWGAIAFSELHGRHCQMSGDKASFSFILLYCFYSIFFLRLEIEYLFSWLCLRKNWRAWVSILECKLCWLSCLVTSGVFSCI